MSKNKIVSIVVGLAVVLVAGGIAFSQPKSSGYGKPTTSAAPAATGSYTLAQVAAHTDAKSCWTTINGGVYDVTPWISQHPGGAAAILSLCGKDGSAAFTDQHSGQARPASELAGFKIGTLSK